ncbi:G8 domain-containing protein [Nonlabens xiamenensis]|uniref:G8 domain-containing protein n=1 Tax=Nonlabens xiamenensis TaxID=2341043 RepID=UPI000F60FFBD|nr:G8 domain-containing protein [Nonlabens xiamenensis]
MVWTKLLLYRLSILTTVVIWYSFMGFNNSKALISSSIECAPTTLLSVSAVNDGVWNNPATWSNNQIPTSADDVTIPAGVTVSLSGAIQARTIMVEGILTTETLTADFDMSTKGIMVHSGGALEIGTETNPYLGNGIITLNGSNPNEVLMSPAMGAKLIGVMGNGRLDLHGAPKISWTQLNATAAVGTQTITLKEMVDWQVGDEIVIASTDFDPHQAEKRVITAINGLNLTLDTPLQYMHWGTEQIYNDGSNDRILDERAEVGLLTRNLKIQGDTSSENNGYGGHIMSMPNSLSKASNIELFRMGQKSQVGRYPWHWHLLGDAPGQYIKNAGIHRSYNRLVTVHGTNYTLVEGNVGYDFIGHGYFLEDGNEIRNLFKDNLGVVCKRPVVGEETTPHDLGIGADRGASPEAFPVTFWITNPNNDFIGNVSAGSDGSGFWHLVLDEVLDGSNSGYVPGHQPMGVFDDNKAHSNLFSWGIDGGIDEVTEEIEAGHYRPRNPDGSQFVPVINRFDGYKSVDRNVWIRANTMDFYDCDFGDNGRADFFSYNQTLYNSLIVGKSANIGNPQSASELQAGRSLPFPNRSIDAFTNAFRGHSIYDGPSGIVDTHFAGFDQVGARSYCFQTNGASRKSTNHFARGITFDPAIPENAKFDFQNNSFFSYMYLSGLIDEDGSITGVPGTNIRPDIIPHPNGQNLYEKGANIQMSNIIGKPEWGAWLTQNKTYNYFKDTDFTDKSAAAFTPRYFITQYPDLSTHAVFNTQTQQLYFDAPVITNDLDYTYYMQYHKLPKYMLGEVNGAVGNSENVIVAYPNIPSIAYAGNATRVTSMAQLKASASQAYFIKDNTVFVKHITNVVRSDFQQRQFGSDYKYESNQVFICNSGNCFDNTTWGDVLNQVTLIDYGVRSMNLGSVVTNNDSRDAVSTTDGLSVPTLSYANTRVSFNVQNNGNGTDGYTDYEIDLEARQVWEYFETLNVDYTGPDVELLVVNQTGDTFSAGTYSASDIDKVQIGQDVQFDIFSNVKKLVLRFHESAIGNDLNTAASQPVEINSIRLGSDVPTAYSQSSTPVGQDTDGDGLLDSEEVTLCRDPNTAADFALEFDGLSTFFDGYTTDQLSNVQESNGVFGATSTAGDSKIIHRNVVSFESSEVSSLRVRFKADRSTTSFQIFFETLANSSFSASRSLTAVYTGNGSWEELVLDLSANVDLANQVITGLRIDPTNHSNVNFEIDWIRADAALDPAVSCSYTIDDDGDGLSNGEETDNCRDANSAADFAIEFNGDDIFDGYTTQQLTSVQELNGTLSGISTGSDSKLIKNEFLGIQGSQITSLQVRFKANISSTQFRIFWKNEDGGYAAARSVAANYTGNSSWQTIQLDLSNDQDWIGKTITSLRIDPTNDTNVSFEIDWIRAQDAVDPNNPCGTLSLRNDEIQRQVQLFPNPIAQGDRIGIRGLLQQDKVSIQVFDMSGKRVKVEADHTMLQLIQPKAGIYLVVFEINEHQRLTHKLVVY